MGLYHRRRRARGFSARRRAGCPEPRTLCMTIACADCHLSEALALTAGLAGGLLVFDSAMKRRGAASTAPCRRRPRCSMCSRRLPSSYRPRHASVPARGLRSGRWLASIRTSCGHGSPARAGRTPSARIFALSSAISGLTSRAIAIAFTLPRWVRPHFDKPLKPLGGPLDRFCTHPPLYGATSLTKHCASQASAAAGDQFSRSRPATLSGLNTPVCTMLAGYRCHEVCSAPGRIGQRQVDHGSFSVQGTGCRARA